MTIHDRLPIEHGITETPRGNFVHLYWGKCSCGWSGPMRETAVLAGEDLDEHEEHS